MRNHETTPAIINIAHAAEIGGIHAIWHPHSGDDHDRDQQDDDADNEQHMVLAVVRSSLLSAYNNLGISAGDGLCACSQTVGAVEQRGLH